MSAVVVSIASRTQLARHEVSLVARDVGTARECWHAAHSGSALARFARDIDGGRRRFVELLWVGDGPASPQTATLAAAHDSTVLVLGTTPLADGLRAALDRAGGCAGLSLAPLPELRTPLHALAPLLPRRTRTILEQAGFRDVEELAAVPPAHWTGLDRIATARAEQIGNALAFRRRHLAFAAAERRDQIAAGLAPAALARLAPLIDALAASDLAADVAGDVCRRLARAETPVPPDATGPAPLAPAEPGPPRQEAAR
ncbi:hypothetical protein [Amycolatopsis sp. NPDC004079]|uniref:hypothetical protein n=1 Tax=Amycolatopsis sp. NPDC004079 TaxID=3154549 RepID=UPI0033A00C1C